MNELQAFVEHIKLCNNIKLPGSRIRLFLGAAPIGWVTADCAATIVTCGGLVSSGKAFMFPILRLCFLSSFLPSGYPHHVHFLQSN
jgi:hypothetical protein